MKRFTLISTLLSSLMLAACSQTPVKKAPALPWMQELVCKRADSAQEVIVSVDKLNLAQNNTGCDGSNNPLCDIRIYQIMVESFKHGENGAQGYSMAWGPSEHKGNLRGIIDSLDYIKSVGVNGIWLTPVFEVKPVKGQDLTYDKLDGTGYYTSNYFAIDPKIGTEKEFKELVDKAHSKGLYVFLDGVFGHAKSNVATISPKGNKLYLSNVCRGILGHAEDMSLHLGTCFDTEKSLPFLEEVATYWISKYKIDGWRLDQAYQLAPEHWAKISAAVVAESQNPKNAYRLNGKKVQPLGYTVGEYWTDKPKFLEYTQDTILGYMWRWNWQKNIYGQYDIENLCPVCSRCNTPLVESFSGYREKYKCLRCEMVYSKELPEFAHVKMLISDNVRRKYFPNE